MTSSPVRPPDGAGTNRARTDGAGTDRARTDGAGTDGAGTDAAGTDATGRDAVADLAARVVARLSELGLTVGLAESLTGGALSDALVRVPGASACLRGAVVAYATDVKRDLLGVDDDLLVRRGPVDEEVAVQMAAGARRVLRADLGVGTTGVAGPDPQGGHAPGTFHVAVTDGAATAVRSAEESEPAPEPAPGRQAVRRGVVEVALRLVLEILDGAGTDRGTAALDRT